MFGPLHVEPNDCVLQEVMLGNHLLKQKAKPHLSILQALQASNSLLRRCVLTAFRVCLLNPLSGLLWARFGFHHEVDDMAGNTLPGSLSSSLVDFRKLNFQSEFRYHHSLGHGGKSKWGADWPWTKATFLRVAEKEIISGSQLHTATLLPTSKR